MRNGPVRRDVVCLSQSEVIFNLSFCLSRRFWWYTMKSTKWRLSSTKWRLSSLDIGHSDGSTSAREVTTEAGSPSMFLVQIGPFSCRRCTTVRDKFCQSKIAFLSSIRMMVSPEYNKIFGVFATLSISNITVFFKIFKYVNKCWCFHASFFQ